MAHLDQDSLPTFDIVRVLRQALIAFAFVALLSTYSSGGPAVSQSNAASGTTGGQVQTFVSKP